MPFLCWTYRADYNPDQYLWEKDFTLAGRAYKRQDLEASMHINSHYFVPFAFVSLIQYNVCRLCADFEACYFPALIICSLQMQGVIPCSVATMCHHLFLKTLLFLVLYTAMETGKRWSLRKFLSLDTSVQFCIFIILCTDSLYLY